MKQQIIKFFSIVLFTIALTACGFHLRGFQDVPVSLQNIYLETTTPYSSFSLNLKQILRSAKIHFVASPKYADIVLQILSENFQQTLNNISTNTQTRTYTLIYTVTYQLTSPKGSVLFGPKTITTSSSYASNDSQLLADQDVLEMQKNQMSQDLTELMLNQLASQQVRQILANYQR